MKLRTVIFVFLVTIMLSNLSVNAQNRSTRLLYCNERGTVRDAKNFPSGAETIKGVKYLVWRAALNSKGRYALAITGWSNFKTSIYFKIGKGRNFKWKRAKFNAPAGIQTHSRTGRYFQTYTLRQYRDGYREFFIAIKPVSRGKYTAAWHTTDCPRTTPRSRGTSKRCQWVRKGGLYGLRPYWACQCGGKSAKATKCGKKPRSKP